MNQATARGAAMFQRWVCLIALFSLVIAAGCGAQDFHASHVQTELAAINAAAERADLNSPQTDRKLVYSGQLRLAVKSLDDTERDLKRLVAASDGQIAEFREERTAGDHRAGKWKLRIPPGKFIEFVDQVARLGVAELREVSVADVTEEFVDVEARLKNKRQLEARILKLLEEKTGAIQDVVSVENELARVREEIERIEGRLRVLAAQIELSTLTIFAFERQEYLPPTAPTFSERVAASFFGSLQIMRELGEQLVIATVALGPWFVLLIVTLLTLWLMVIIFRLRFIRRVT